MSENTFMAGFGKAHISPTESVPLQGFGNGFFRRSTEVEVDLYSVCLAVRDGEGNTAVIISVDSGSIGSDICEMVRNGIEEKTGVPAKNILVTAIHQHATPNFWMDGVEATDRYREFFVKETVQAGVDAINDLSPAEMYTATVKTEGLTFVKHYIMNDGSYGGDLYGSFASGIRCHETEADSDLQIVKIVREGKKDILFCNFQGHPHRGTSGKSGIASSNAPGVFREEAAKLLNSDVLYVSGAQGNLNMHSRVKEEMKNENYMEDGKSLARYAQQAEGTYQKVSGGKVQATILTYTGHTDHSMDYLLEEAKVIAKRWQTDANSKEAMALATSGKIHSVYHAEAIIAKQKQGPTRQLDLMAISFGDVAICGGPYEMFDTNGMEIKQGSPFTMTFAANMVNGAIGYVPSALCFAHGCYPADITRFAPGSGEEFRDEFLKMLHAQRSAQ